MRGIDFPGPVLDVDLPAHPGGDLEDIALGIGVEAAEEIEPAAHRPRRIGAGAGVEQIGQRRADGIEIALVGAETG